MKSSKARSLNPHKCHVLIWQYIKFHVNPSCVSRPTFMHSVFSPTESQQGCSYPDGEHPIHLSRIRISTAHLTTTLHLHVFLWDDDKWLLGVFFSERPNPPWLCLSPPLIATSVPNEPQNHGSQQVHGKFHLFGVTNSKWTQMASVFARISEFSHNLISCFVVMYGSMTSEWVSV